MTQAKTAVIEHDLQAAGIPATMRAAVYRGPHCLSLESAPVPAISDDEILVRVHACGICGTDLKKIELGLVPPPRIFGHEIAGTVALAGSRVSQFKPGDRVAVYHHVPCGTCFFCQRRLFSQCPDYRRTGTTAGFEPAGGGFAEYVRVMEWIVRRGATRIPDGISFEEASFLEPLNTCLRALDIAAIQEGEIVAIMGQGPVGLLLTQAAAREGARVAALDLIERRLELALGMGAEIALNPAKEDALEALAGSTNGRGPDLVVVATADPRAVGQAQEMVRRGGRVLLFAQTVPGETIPVDVSRICMEEKKLIGSYSSSMDLHDKAAEWIFSRKVRVAALISHRLPLDRLAEGVRLASTPSEHSLKVIIQP